MAWHEKTSQNEADLLLLFQKIHKLETQFGQWRQTLSLTKFLNSYNSNKTFKPLLHPKTSYAYTFPGILIIWNKILIFQTGLFVQGQSKQIG